MLFLGDVQSALLLAGLVWAIALLVRNYADPQSDRHRGIIFGITALLALRYIYWRATETVAAPALTIWTCTSFVPVF